MTPKRKLRLAGYLAAGSCLFLLANSWVRFWEVELPTTHMAAMDSGNFWEFLGNLPSALQNLSVLQGPENILTILPTVYLWQNIGTTLIFLVFGATLGGMIWFARLPLSDQPSQPKSNKTSLCNEPAHPETN